MKKKLLSLFDAKLWKFLLVGVFNTIFNWVIVFLLLRYAQFTSLAATIVSTVLASILSYFLNRYFTFKYQGSGLASVARFTLNIVVCYILGYGLALFVFYPLFPGITGGAGKILAILSGEKNTKWDYIAALLGSCLFTGFNYLGQRFFAFREEKNKEEQP